MEKTENFEYILVEALASWQNSTNHICTLVIPSNLRPSSLFLLPSSFPFRVTHYVPTVVNARKHTTYSREREFRPQTPRHPYPICINPFCEDVGGNTWSSGRDTMNADRDHSIFLLCGAASTRILLVYQNLGLRIYHETGYRCLIRSKI